MQTRHFLTLLDLTPDEHKALVERDRKDPDITVIDWAQADRDKFREIASKSWEETAGKSREARKALDAHYAYMRKVGLLN